MLALQVHSIRDGPWPAVLRVSHSDGSAGGLAAFDIFGNIRKASLCEPLKVTEKEALDGTLWKLTPYQVGMQVPSGLDSEMPEEGFMWATSKGSGTNPSKVGITEREWNGRREAKGGSCSHGGFDSPEIFGIASGWVCEGQSSIWVARATGRRRNFLGQNFWARGYCVPTIGLDEEAIREYVRSQEEADKKSDQLRMFE
jgi:hypothetical protein